LLSELGRRSYRFARRVAISVIGGTTLLVGIVMIVTPGPALLVIPAGLAILAVEFAWARHWLGKIRERIAASKVPGTTAKDRGPRGQNGD
jgi:uncharacterized protein (TIGR02611 family)